MNDDAYSSQPHYTSRPTTTSLTYLLPPHPPPYTHSYSQLHPLTPTPAHSAPCLEHQSLFHLNLPSLHSQHFYPWPTLTTLLECFSSNHINHCSQHFATWSTHPLLTSSPNHLTPAHSISILSQFSPPFQRVPLPSTSSSVHSIFKLGQLTLFSRSLQTTSPPLTEYQSLDNSQSPFKGFPLP